MIPFDRQRCDRDREKIRCVHLFAHGRDRNLRKRTSAQGSQPFFTQSQESLDFIFTRLISPISLTFDLFSVNEKRGSGLV